MNTKRKPLSERFFEKFSIGDGDSCWEWEASRNKHGYGKIGSGGKHGRTLLASRVMWTLLRGNPGRMRICHTCDNPPCVNIGHLYKGTAKQNTADSIAKGRFKNPPVMFGPKNRASKLTTAAVKYIRRNWRPRKVTYQFFMEKFGVSWATIRRVLRHVTWRGEKS